MFLPKTMGLMSLYTTQQGPELDRKRHGVGDKRKSFHFISFARLFQRLFRLSVVGVALCFLASL